MQLFSKNFLHQKQSIIYCVGEWDLIRFEEEGDENEDENNRFTNTSFFLPFRILRFFFFWRRLNELNL